MLDFSAFRDELEKLSYYRMGLGALGGAVIGAGVGALTGKKKDWKKRALVGAGIGGLGGGLAGLGARKLMPLAKGNKILTPTVQPEVSAPAKDIFARQKSWLKTRPEWAKIEHETNPGSALDKQFQAILKEPDKVWSYGDPGLSDLLKGHK
jgi:hypothetical protein